MPAPGLGAASGGRLRALAVEVKDRTIQTVKTVTVVQHHTTQVPLPTQPGTVAEFVQVLADLTGRVDSGRLYERDLPTLAAAVRELVDALARREKATAHSPW